MATEADQVNCGAFVNRLTRGHKRTFFQLSIPNTWADRLVDGRKVQMLPHEAMIDLAKVLDLALQPRSTE